MSWKFSERAVSPTTSSTSGGRAPAGRGVSVASAATISGGPLGFFCFWTTSAALAQIALIGLTILVSTLWLRRVEASSAVRVAARPTPSASASATLARFQPSRWYQRRSVSRWRQSQSSGSSAITATCAARPQPIRSRVSRTSVCSALVIIALSMTTP